MPYVASAGNPPLDPAGCIFCDALTAGDDRGALILRRAPLAFLILNKFPYASGHVMAVVTRHVGTLEEATSDELAQSMDPVQAPVRALRSAHPPHGFNPGAQPGS